MNRASGAFVKPCGTGAAFFAGLQRIIFRFQWSALNRRRVASWFVQFIISASLLAQTPKPSPSNAIGDGDTVVVFQVTDLTGATVAHANIVVKDAAGRTTMQAQTDQDGICTL